MAVVDDFQKFLLNDQQLKSAGDCVRQVNLFNNGTYSSDHSKSFHQQSRPNREALVLDAEACLDRLYGGYFPDWSCGGQWRNMIAFLSTLFSSCHRANVHFAVFFNGATEPSRFQDWVRAQLKLKSNVNQVMKHLTKRMTPPPKAFWVPPCGVRTMLRLALRSLNVNVLNSLDDHHLEIMSFCWENGYHGVLSETGEFALFNPPKYFSAHDIKLSFQHDLLTTEFVLDNAAKALDLNPNRFSVVAALLGNHILTVSDLKQFHMTIAPETNQEGSKQKVASEKVIRAVVNYVRALPDAEDFDAIAKDVFGSEKDPRVKKLRAAVKYFFRGTKDGYSKQKPTRKKASGDTIKLATEQEEIAKAGTKQSKAESDLVERIALDLDQLDLNEAVAKVRQELCQEDESSQNISIVQALASGAEAAPSEAGRYPQKDTASVRPIHIPQAHFEVLRTVNERHRQGLMSPFIYQLLSKGEIKLPVVMEGDVLPQVHKFYQPLRQIVYAIIFNLTHARFDRRQVEEKIKALRRKADDLRKRAKHDGLSSTESEEMRAEATKLIKEAADTSLPDLVNFVVREWLPYNNYEAPDAVEAAELAWPVPSIQRLWFGNSAEDKHKRLQAFLTCMHSNDVQSLLVHSNVPPHMLMMACVLRYMLVQGSKESSDLPVLRKPELDAFLATALSPELRDVTYLVDMRLEMVTIRGVHLATLFMQGIEMALMANDACGAPIPVQMCLPWTFFDGKLFHSKLIRAAHARNLVELCDGRVEMAYSIERLRDAIMYGPSLAAIGRPIAAGPYPNRTYPKQPFQGHKKKQNKQTNSAVRSKSDGVSEAKKSEQLPS